MFKTECKNLWIANIIGQHNLVPINGEPPVRYNALNKALLKLLCSLKLNIFISICQD